MSLFLYLFDSLGVNFFQDETHEQLRKRISSLAKKQDMRPKELARELHVNIHRLAQITRKHFDCTATELIVRVQREKQEDAEKQKRPSNDDLS